MSNDKISMAYKPVDNTDIVMAYQASASHFHGVAARHLEGLSRSGTKYGDKGYAIEAQMTAKHHAAKARELMGLEG